jgi:hypothetical protein
LGRGDLRVLTATGATSATRRTLTAATTAALALAGALLGAAIAYISLIAGYWPATGRLSQIPYTEFTILNAGIPSPPAPPHGSSSAENPPTSTAPRSHSSRISFPRSGDRRSLTGRKE